MSVQPSVVKDKKGQKTFIGRLKPGRYGAVSGYISGAGKNIYVRVLPDYRNNAILSFPNRLVLAHLPSHRGPRTSLRPRHR